MTIKDFNIQNRRITILILKYNLLYHTLGVGYVDGETWCVIVRNDIYGDSSSVIINKSQEISLINFYFNKTVFTHFIKKHMFKNPLFLTLLNCTNIYIHMMNLII